jgi:hypothetical protein
VEGGKEWNSVANYRKDLCLDQIDSEQEPGEKLLRPWESSQVGQNDQKKRQNSKGVTNVAMRAPLLLPGEEAETPRNTWIKMAAGNSQESITYSIRVHLTIKLILYESNGLKIVCCVPESVTALSRGSWRMLNIHLRTPCLLHRFCSRRFCQLFCFVRHLQEPTLPHLLEQVRRAS